MKQVGKATKSVKELMEKAHEHVSKPKIQAPLPKIKVLPDPAPNFPSSFGPGEVKDKVEVPAYPSPNFPPSFGPGKD